MRSVKSCLGLFCLSINPPDLASPAINYTRRGNKSLLSKLAAPRRKSNALPKGEQGIISMRQQMFPCIVAGSSSTASIDYHTYKGPESFPPPKRLHPWNTCAPFSYAARKNMRSLLSEGGIPARPKNMCAKTLRPRFDAINAQRACLLFQRIRDGAPVQDVWWCLL